jgi:hypothetical protein
MNGKTEFKEKHNVYSTTDICTKLGFNVSAEFIESLGFPPDFPFNAHRASYWLKEKFVPITVAINNHILEIRNRHGEVYPKHTYKDEDIPNNPTTQGVKYDSDKPDWSLLPMDIIEDVVDVLTFGAKKYDRENWKKVPDLHNRYFAAAMRHLVAYQSGEEIDPESGKSHLAHAQCCLIFLAWVDKNHVSKDFYNPELSNE